ncbi:hypothetical protein BJ742DRAFT_737188 [Cladochytrium replicatum]|nr:hypothetical protein BJ742DRAFT_737188 [Cladochytrium replicatum]
MLTEFQFSRNKSETKIAILVTPWFDIKNKSGLHGSISSVFAGVTNFLALHSRKPVSQQHHFETDTFAKESFRSHQAGGGVRAKLYGTLTTWLKTKLVHCLFLFLSIVPTLDHERLERLCSSYLKKYEFFHFNRFLGDLHWVTVCRNIRTLHWVNVCRNVRTFLRKKELIHKSRNPDSESYQSRLNIPHRRGACTHMGGLSHRLTCQVLQNDKEIGKFDFFNLDTRTQ